MLPLSFHVNSHFNNTETLHLEKRFRSGLWLVAALTFSFKVPKHLITIILLVSLPPPTPDSGKLVATSESAKRQTTSCNFSTNPKWILFLLKQRLLLMTLLSMFVMLALLCGCHGNLTWLLFTRRLLLLLLLLVMMPLTCYCATVWRRSCWHTHTHTDVGLLSVPHNAPSPRPHPNVSNITNLTNPDHVSTFVDGHHLSPQHHQFRVYTVQRWKITKYLYSSTVWGIHMLLYTNIELTVKKTRGCDKCLTLVCDSSTEAAEFVVI